MQQRREEIQAKKARLEELKRQRKLRQDQFAQSKPAEDGSTLYSPSPSRASSNREELDSLISTLVGDSRPASAGARDAGPAAVKGSRPNSVLSAGDLSIANSGSASPSGTNTQGFTTQPSSNTPQSLSTAPLFTLYEFAPAPVKEVYTYSKAVQTSEPWSPGPISSEDALDEEAEASARRRWSRREREEDEALREAIRREIEEESKRKGEVGPAGGRPPVRLSEEEVNVVTSSHDFIDFVERSSKVIERALDQEYDVLADYAFGGIEGPNDEEDDAKVKEVAQFWDERWSKKRMISSIEFSPKFPELVLGSYTKNPSAPNDPDGLVQVWNLHLRDRPEYVFHAQSDVLVAKFSPFHPSLIVGGAYSGQVLLWDTRAKAAPVQKTPLTGSGHTHPVYSIDMVGTQNANNILSCSTDGVVCGWTVDMLAQPQEFISLATPPPSKSEDLSPTCMAFPSTDPTYFLVGTEEGSIYPCHRYDRAGAKAGVDQRLSYRGHAAPVMSLDFHPSRGPIDLGDLVLSSSLDWSVKLWRVRAPTTASSSTSSSSIAAGAQPQAAAPLLDIPRDDLVYDAAWSPVKPGVFSLVDGAGNLELWDLAQDIEIPIAQVQPSRSKLSGPLQPVPVPSSIIAAADTTGGNNGTTTSQTKTAAPATASTTTTTTGGFEYGRSASSLNKVAWDPHAGKRLAVGGLDGVMTVFEVGPGIGGAEAARAEEWPVMRKLVNRLESGGGGGLM